jgi:DNA-binding beta-propeller fold protein YncE
VLTPVEMKIKLFTSTFGVIGVALFSATCAKAFNIGDVFASIGNGEVNVYSPTGTLEQTLNTGLGGATTGSVFDSQGNFYVTDFLSAGNVSEFNSNGNLIGTFGSGYTTHPESIALDRSGNFYVGEADGDHHVQKLDATGANTGSFFPAIEDRGTDWVDLASDQHTLFYTSEGKSIKRFDVATNTQLSNFATNLPGSNAYAFRILGDGGVLVADSDAVLRLNSSGAILQTYDPSNSSELFALNLDPDGKTFWTGDLLTGKIFRLDIVTGDILKEIDTGSAGLAGLSINGQITQAVPEPSVYLLSVIGLIGVMVRYRRLTA